MKSHQESKLIAHSFIHQIAPRVDQTPPSRVIYHELHHLPCLKSTQTAAPALFPWAYKVVAAGIPSKSTLVPPFTLPIPGSEFLVVFNNSRKELIAGAPKTYHRRFLLSRACGMKGARPELSTANRLCKSFIYTAG